MYKIQSFVAVMLMVPALAACSASLRSVSLDPVGYGRATGAVKIAPTQYLVGDYPQDSDKIHGVTFVPLKLSEPVATYVGRRIGLEIAASGVNVSDAASITLQPQVLHLNEDCSLSTCFSAEIRYVISDSKTGSQILERRYYGLHHPNGAQFKWSQSKVYAAVDQTLNQTIYDTVDRLLSDPQVQELLKTPKSN